MRLAVSQSECLYLILSPIPESVLPVYRSADGPREEKPPGVMDDRIRIMKVLDSMEDGTNIVR